MNYSTSQRVSFGDLPTDGQEMLTRHLAIDFSHTVMKSPRWFCAWARNSAGNITGIFAAEFCVWFDAKVTVLILDPHCCTRRALRAIFTALFSQARRLTAEVEPGNLRSLQQVQRLGFFQEGYRPLGLEGTRDTILFGMVKDECPWLRSYVPPADTLSDATYRRRSHTVVGSDLGLRARVGTNSEHLSLGEFSQSSVLSTSGFPFEQVLALGNPANVRGTNTAAISASVCGDDVSHRIGSVRPNADKTMNLAASAVVPHLSVAPLINGKWPDKALRTFVRERSDERIFRS